MFTVCPKCTLTLALTANDLRVGQGYVRCGRCSNVFNALLKLSEALGDAEAAAPAPPQADPASTSQIRQALSSAALSASERPQVPKPASAPATTSTPAPAPAMPSMPSTATAAATNAAAAARRSGGTEVPEVPRHTNADAIDQFERVLQTLGISLLEDEPAAVPSTTPSAAPSAAPPTAPSAASPTSSERGPAARRPGAGSRPQPQPRPPPRQAVPDRRDYDSVENIVLEGDAVTHGGETPADASSGSPSGLPVDEPVDELDALTRRLSAAATETDITQERRAQQRRAWERRAEARQGDAAPIFGTRHPDIIEFELADAGTSGFGAAALGSEGAADEAAIDLDIPGLEPAQRRWPWILGCAVLALLLALQSLNHWRDALAASPTWGGPLTRGYAALGLPLRPHWNLGAFDVRQEGAEADATAQQVIHVRLSLANRAPRAQPTPLLRLTLLDRYGKRIAQRDLTPADYWPKGRAPERFMASDERIDSEVAVRDPSAASASFELDVCLRDAGGTVRCANDATPMANAGVP